MGEGESHPLRHFENVSAGEVAEWFNAAVLKTVVPQGTRGSNPLFSAILLKKGGHR